MAFNQKKITLLSFLSFIVLFTAASIRPGKKYKNLKVLPQDISERKLDSIMDSYCRALHVSCEFCHAKPKQNMFSITPNSDTADFSLDNPMKEDARRMIRLQMDINKNYFYFDSLVRPEYLNVVSCNTCHRGNPYPANQ